MRTQMIFWAGLTVLGHMALNSVPAYAGYCQSGRSVAVGRAEWPKNAQASCRTQLVEKGKALYGSNFGGLNGFAMSCEELGDPTNDKHFKGGDFWQCICSAYLCRKLKVDPSRDEDLARPKPHGAPDAWRELNRSFAPRKGIPPSFGGRGRGSPPVKLR